MPPTRAVWAKDSVIWVPIINFNNFFLLLYKQFQILTIRKVEIPTQPLAPRTLHLTCHSDIRCHDWWPQHHTGQAIPATRRSGPRSPWSPVMTRFQTQVLCNSIWLMEYNSHIWNTSYKVPGIYLVRICGTRWPSRSGSGWVRTHLTYMPHFTSLMTSQDSQTSSCT